MRIVFAILLFWLASVIDAEELNAQQAFSVAIHFTNKVANDTLELGNEYKNSFNEPYTVLQFKYYISNISFTTNDGGSVKDEGYYLINEVDSTSKTITLTANKNSLNTLSFLIGVDSVRNVSGTQTGALDPTNGMFWTWNSGYIMAKLEATSPLSKSPNNGASYHIGGFKFNQDATRRVTLKFPGDKEIQLSKEKTTTIFIEADVNKWFNGKHELKIADHPACTTPGALAVKYADNYANMFRIISTNN